MGAYSPAPVLTPTLEAAVMDRIIRPPVATLAAEGAPYVGVLLAGLMLTDEGPKLIEYNCRFGDLDCRLLTMRFAGDLTGRAQAAAKGHTAVSPPAALAEDLAQHGGMAAEGKHRTPET